jgi:hypothetical protein
MPSYVMLVNWTDQGVRAICDLPKRIDAAKRMLKDMGGHFTSLHATMGAYDLVGIDAGAGRRGGAALHPDAATARQRPHHLAQGLPESPWRETGQVHR